MKKLIVLMMIPAICLTMTGCGCDNKEKNETNTQTEENGEKVNNSEELNKDKTFNGYKISGISLKTENGSNILTATIENVSGSNTEAGVYNIVFVDKSGKEISKIALFINALKPNETVEIKSSINLDVIDSYDLKLEKA
ncbi:MAG: hypothetical protein NC181_00520 [Clostridium sp.]|nr:hypothetical protein [Clostridium sp.]MCM1443851.1 hypothetical protein [Candidatus Amulumruptor caecigallinarius]